MKSDNYLIAEFLGWFKLPDQPQTWFRKTDCSIVVAHSEYVKPLQFDVDWDWIMPVLEKIEREDNPFCEIRQSVDIVNGQRKVVGWEVLLWKHDSSTIVSKSNVKLDAIYRAVVDYIKWYNEKNK